MTSRGTSWQEAPTKTAQRSAARPTANSTAGTTAAAELISPVPPRQPTGEASSTIRRTSAASTTAASKNPKPTLKIADAPTKNRPDVDAAPSGAAISQRTSPADTASSASSSTNATRKPIRAVVWCWACANHQNPASRTRTTAASARNPARNSPRRGLMTGPFAGEPHLDAAQRAEVRHDVAARVDRARWGRRPGRDDVAQAQRTAVTREFHRQPVQRQPRVAEHQAAAATGELFAVGVQDDRLPRQLEVAPARHRASLDEPARARHVGEQLRPARVLVVGVAAVRHLQREEHRVDGVEHRGQRWRHARIGLEPEGELGFGDAHRHRVGRHRLALGVAEPLEHHARQRARDVEVLPGVRGGRGDLPAGHRAGQLGERRLRGHALGGVARAGVVRQPLEAFPGPPRVPDQFRRPLSVHAPDLANRKTGCRSASAAKASAASLSFASKNGAVTGILRTYARRTGPAVAASASSTVHVSRVRPRRSRAVASARRLCPQPTCPYGETSQRSPPTSRTLTGVVRSAPLLRPRVVSRYPVLPVIGTPRSSNAFTTTFAAFRVTPSRYFLAITGA